MLTVSLVEAVGLFTGVTLLAMALVLLVMGRRRDSDLVLSAFLATVGLNFLLDMASKTLASDWPLRRLADAALAVDPLFLLLFATLYPFHRRGRQRNLLLAVGVVLTLVAGWAVIVRPTDPLSFPWGDAPTWRVLLVANLAYAYTATWYLVIDGLVQAPTRHLERRASWMLLAVGVAVPARLGLLPVDAGYRPAYALARGTTETLTGAAWISVQDVLPFVVIVGLCYAVARARLRDRSGPASGALKVVAWVLAAFVLARLLSNLGAFWGGGSLGPVYLAPYTIRWPVFAAILVYGVLAHEVVPFDRAAPTAFSLLGGFLAAVAGVLAGMVLVGEVVTGGDLLGPLALGGALAAPGAWGTRSAVRWIEARADRGTGTARRLALYRAALEAAYAEGPPDRPQRRQLERERRAFGLSHQEARALEHVVASGHDGPAPRLTPGSEPVPGLALEERLGGGAQAQVFLARRYPSGDRVVAKVFEAPAGTGQELHGDLMSELRALSRLDHPSIVRLLDVHAVPGRYLLVLEHVPGRSLDEVLDSGPLDEEQVHRLARELLGAVQAAHDQGVLHRDLKPGNVLSGEDGRFRVLDFGVAMVRAPAGPVPSQTVTGFQGLQGLTGTLAYMAPEQAREEPVDQATDLYQAGLVLYEAITGERALDIEGLGTYQALDVLASPEVDLEKLPQAWRPALSRALDPDPDQRFADAATMLAALPVPPSPAPPGPGEAVSS